MYDISAAIVHILHTVKQLLIIGKTKLERVIFPTAKKIKGLLNIKNGRVACTEQCS